MILFKKYHKIPQYRGVVKSICSVADFKGLDEEGVAIYVDSEKPVLTAKGHVKLHGTNALISYTPTDGLQAGKRKSLVGKDSLRAHFMFNQFVQVTKKDTLIEIMDTLWREHCVEGEQITLYGEWAGNGVQKGVGISLLPKSFFVFDCKKTNLDTDESEWIDIEGLRFPSIDNMYNIDEFPTFEVEIDFNKPALIQNRLVEITNQVEKDCPVAKQLLGETDKELVGEGVVWRFFWKGQKYIFKVKGEKHSTSKVKKLAQIDPEVLKSINEFVEYACTENRINQGIQEVDAKSKSDTRDLVSWVSRDIIKEESDVLKASGLTYKQVAKSCSKVIVNHFFKTLNL